MKKIFLGILLLSSILSADLKYVKDIVSSMQSNIIEYKNDILYIQLLREDRVTTRITTTIIENAYCSDIWLNGKESFLKSFSKIKAVVVLNKHSHQSIIYKGNYSDCVELGKLPSKDVAIHISSKLTFATGNSLKKELYKLSNQ